MRADFRGRTPIRQSDNLHAALQLGNTFVFPPASFLQHRRSRHVIEDADRMTPNLVIPANRHDMLLCDRVLPVLHHVPVSLRASGSLSR